MRHQCQGRNHLIKRMIGWILDLDDDEETPTPPYDEETQLLPSPLKTIWTILANLTMRVNRMVVGIEEMRRNQEAMKKNHEVHIWHIGANFGFPFDGYAFHYPPPSRLIPCDPSEGDDGEI